jgi:hypothetical protein
MGIVCQAGSILIPAFGEEFILKNKQQRVCSG